MTSTWELDGWTAYTGAPPADDLGCRWKVLRHTGWAGSTGVRGMTDDRPRQDGGESGESFRKARLVTVSGRVEAPDHDSLIAGMERLSALLSNPQVATLAVTSEAGLRRQADVELADDVDITQVSGRWARWTLDLRAPDHRKYGDEQTAQTGLPVATTGLTLDAVTGVTLDAVTGVTLAAGGADGLVQVTNGGRAATHPVLEFVGPVLGPRVQSLTTGLSLDFSTDVPAGQSLLIDTYAGTVLLNGVTDRRVDLSAVSAFVQDFTLLPGVNELAFRAVSSPGGALFNCTFRPAWL